MWRCVTNWRAAARQLVTHRHITVNGDVMNIPSYSVNLGDEIAVREKSKSLEVVSKEKNRNGIIKLKIFII